ETYSLLSSALVIALVVALLDADGSASTVVVALVLTLVARGSQKDGLQATDGSALLAALLDANGSGAGVDALVLARVAVVVGEHWHDRALLLAGGGALLDADGRAAGLLARLHAHRKARRHVGGTATAGLSEASALPSHSSEQSATARLLFLCSQCDCCGDQRDQTEGAEHLE
ncbi:hypothetical protein PENTCL1PPCAC_5660, partial [Pristionchus entomophagus]